MRGKKRTHLPSTSSWDKPPTVTFSSDQAKKVLTIPSVAGKNGTEIVTAWQTWSEQPGNATTGFSITPKDGGADPVTGRDPGLHPIHQHRPVQSNQGRPEPATGGVAGQCGRGRHLRPGGRERGVWKAPANVSLAAVIGPVTKIAHADQETLNVDPTPANRLTPSVSLRGKARWSGEPARWQGTTTSGAMCRCGGCST